MFEITRTSAVMYIGKLNNIEATSILKETKRATPALKCGLSGCMIHLYLSTAVKNRSILMNSLVRVHYWELIEVGFFGYCLCSMKASEIEFKLPGSVKPNAFQLSAALPSPTHVI